MRRLKRNQSTFVYRRYLGQADEIKDGLKTGHHIEQYADPVYLKGLLVYRGTSEYKPWGIDDQFRLQIIPDNPIPDVSTKDKIIVFTRNGGSDYLDGGQFIPWEAMFDSDGGRLSPWTDGYVADGGLLIYPVEYMVKSHPRTMNEQRLFCQ